METATLPTPAERLRGDWFDFYDPAKGEQRSDFCRYYAEVTTGLITRLAKALKDGSDGRFYTRPMAGYQPGGPHFRFHVGPHADFATVLDCPWIDGFFMPNDYRGRGLGGFTAFEIPVASVQIHGKTYITEVDDATHRTPDWPCIRTETAWQTAQSAKRTIAAALCYASGAEFKDWANGWWEDEETMALIRQLNRLAQDSAQARPHADVADCRGHQPAFDHVPARRIEALPDVEPPTDAHGLSSDRRAARSDHDRRPAQIPRLQALHYSGLPPSHRRTASDAQRRCLPERQDRALALRAGIVGDHGLSVDGVGELVGMKLAVQEMTGQYRLRLVSGTHAYTQGVIPKEYLAEDEIGPLLYVADPGVTELGRAWHNNIKTTKPAFAVKKMPDWTSVYCSVPRLPTAVIRNIAALPGRTSMWTTTTSWRPTTGC